MNNKGLTNLKDDGSNGVELNRVQSTGCGFVIYGIISGAATVGKIYGASGLPAWIPKDGF
jgi:hypothetical protein